MLEDELSNTGQASFNRNKLSERSQESLLNKPKSNWLPYLEDEGTTEKEYCAEWKNYLINKNLNNIKSCNKFRFAFYTPKLVKSIFNICRLLKQPPEVRYLALDILDRFLSRHFFVVVETYKATESLDVNDWSMVVQRMMNQFLLRVLTSIQLAVKYYSTCHVITVNTIQNVMKYLNHPCSYSKKNINKSEARVFKTLNYTIPTTTPLTYIEMLYEDFHNKISPRITSSHNFLRMCIDILDLATIYQRKIYENSSKHFQSIWNSKTTKPHDCLSKVKGDFMTYGASVTLAACTINGFGKEFTEYIFRGGTSIHDTQRLCIIILGEEILKIIHEKV